MLHAYGGGGTANLRPGTEVAQPKTDTKIRKTLELDWPSQPEKIWGVELWGYAVRADLGLVNKALSTPPHPGCQVVGSLETSWYVPRLLLKVWKAPAEILPQVIKITNEITGEEFVRVPSQYVGTPFDAHAREEDLWFPRPLPEEQYRPWNVHPVYSEDVQTMLRNRNS